MTVRIFAALSGLVLTGLAASAQRATLPAGSVTQRGDGSRLVFFSDKKPVLLRLHVHVDGQPIDQAWNAYIKRWFDFLDRDGDANLNAQELRFAPREQTMLQLMRQPGIFFNPGAGLRMTELGKKEDDKIALEDFQRYYQKQRVGAVQVSVNPATANVNPVGEGLFKLIDQDRDGKLSRAELAQADKTVARLDTDDDEMVLAQEIAPNPNQALGRVVFPDAPMKAPSPRIGASFYTPAVDADSALAILLLSQYDADKNRTLSRAEVGLSKEAFAGLDKNEDNELDAEELARWHLRGPDLAFTVRLGRGGDGPAVELHKGLDRKFQGAVTPSSEGQLLTLGDSQIQLLRGSAAQVRFAARNELEFIFRQIDNKNQGYIEMKDIQANRQFQVLGQMFPMVDRDGDGKMTLKEVQAFMELQSGGTNTVAAITISEHGRNLFQLLDANGDNRLSLRELKSAWARLQSRDNDGDGCIDTSELTRQFQVSVDRGGQQFIAPPRALGQPVATARPTYPRNTPLWFQRMDRNFDGDVSFREFLGTREEFGRIDADADGLLSPDEAIRHDEALRKQ